MTAPEKSLNLREQQKRFTKQRLIDAAVQVFSELGYVSATVEDIASAAGSSRATFYLHFSTKKDIIEELRLSMNAAARGTYVELEESGSSWQDLRCWMEKKVAFWDDHKQIINIVAQALTVEPGLHPVDTALVTSYLQRRGNLDPVTADVRAKLLIMQLERFCFHWKVMNLKFDEDYALDALTDIWWATLHIAKDASHRRAA